MPDLPLYSCLFLPFQVFLFNGLFSPAMELTDILILCQCSISWLCFVFQLHILPSYFFLFKIPNLVPATKTVQVWFHTLLLHKGININENKHWYQPIFCIDTSKIYH